MEKPKTFWLVCWKGEEAMWERKEDALASAAKWAKDEQCIAHVFQCTPVMTYNPVVEEKSWD